MRDVNIKSFDELYAMYILLFRFYCPSIRFLHRAIVIFHSKSTIEFDDITVSFAYVNAFYNRGIGQHTNNYKNQLLSILVSVHLRNS